jgi:hypothetical protein
MECIDYLDGEYNSGFLPDSYTMVNSLNRQIKDLQDFPELPFLKRKIKGDTCKYYFGILRVFKIKR